MDAGSGLEPNPDPSFSKSLLILYFYFAANLLTEIKLLSHKDSSGEHQKENIMLKWNKKKYVLYQKIGTLFKVNFAPI